MRTCFGESSVEEREEDWRVVSRWNRALGIRLTARGLGVERNMKQNSRTKQWENMSRMAGGGVARAERMTLLYNRSRSPFKGLLVLAEQQQRLPSVLLPNKATLPTRGRHLLVGPGKPLVFHTTPFLFPEWFPVYFLRSGAIRRRIHRVIVRGICICIVRARGTVRNVWRFAPSARSYALCCLCLIFCCPFQLL